MVPTARVGRKRMYDEGALFRLKNFSRSLHLVSPCGEARDPEKQLVGQGEGKVCVVEREW